MKNLVIALLLCFSILQLSAQRSEKDREYYQLSIYRFFTAEQEKVIDNYISKALIPAYHRQNIKSVGAFKPIGNDTSRIKVVMVLIPLSNLQQIDALTMRLQNDKTYLTEGKEYLEAPYNASPIQRLESWVLKAFALAPKMKLPKLTSPKADHIYEFRSYESATESLYRNKVKMFNEGGEIALFDRLGFNAIFYSETIAGSRMPNLVYMTSFENMDERNKHWKAFVDDPEWKKLIAMEEYKNNVSRNETILMKAAEYSDY